MHVLDGADFRKYSETAYRDALATNQAVAARARGQGICCG